MNIVWLDTLLLRALLLEEPGPEKR